MNLNQNWIFWQFKSCLLIQLILNDSIFKLNQKFEFEFRINSILKWIGQTLIAYRVTNKPTLYKDKVLWSRGMILACGVRGPGFNSPMGLHEYVYHFRLISSTHFYDSIFFFKYLLKERRICLTVLQYLHLGVQRITN